jgi:hypothetical protein
VTAPTIYETVGTATVRNHNKRTRKQAKWSRNRPCISPIHEEKQLAARLLAS